MSSPTVGWQTLLHYDKASTKEITTRWLPTDDLNHFWRKTQIRWVDDDDFPTEHFSRPRSPPRLEDIARAFLLTTSARISLEGVGSRNLKMINDLNDFIDAREKVFYPVSLEYKSATDRPNLDFPSSTVKSMANFMSSFLVGIFSDVYELENTKFFLTFASGKAVSETMLHHNYGFYRSMGDCFYSKSGGGTMNISMFNSSTHIDGNVYRLKYAFVLDIETKMGPLEKMPLKAEGEMALHVMGSKLVYSNKEIITEQSFRQNYCLKSEITGSFEQMELPAELTTVKNEQLVQLMLHEPLAPVRPVASLWRMFSAGYDWAYDIPVQTPTPPSPPLLPVLAPHARDTLNLAIGAILEATTDEDTDEDYFDYDITSDL